MGGKCRKKLFIKCSSKRQIVKKITQKRHANISEKAKKTAKMVRAALISF